MKECKTQPTQPFYCNCSESGKFSNSGFFFCRLSNTTNTRKKLWNVAFMEQKIKRIIYIILYMYYIMIDKYCGVSRFVKHARYVNLCLHAANEVNQAKLSYINSGKYLDTEQLSHQASVILKRNHGTLGRSYCLGNRRFLWYW